MSQPIGETAGHVFTPPSMSARNLAAPGLAYYPGGL